MSSPPPPPRWAIGLLAMPFAIYLGWALYLSITDIFSYDDFEVYHYIGGVAGEQRADIYELKTPHQQRGPFLYPVSAAVLFIPFSWLPHDVAGVIFSIVKVVCLLLLWWGAVRFSGYPPRDNLGVLLAMLAPAIMLHRPVASDIGNGQINVILVAAAVGGVWLMMITKRASWIACGALLLAWAIAIKMTPLLLLAVPLLHRRWKGLGLCLAFTIILMLILPIAWFGVEEYRAMARQYGQIAARFTFDWPAPHEQSTPTELLQFARLQTGGAQTMAADTPEILPVPISGYAGERLFEPQFRLPAMKFWWALGLTIGAAYLVVRRLILCGTKMNSDRFTTGADWTWDLAMLCALLVLLSPRVQKAHLVILIVPAGWLAGRICNWFAPEHGRAGVRRALWAVAAYTCLCVMFIVAEDVHIPIPGWEEPAHFLALVGLCMMIVMLVVVERVDCRRTNPLSLGQQQSSKLRGSAEGEGWGKGALHQGAPSAFAPSPPASLPRDGSKGEGSIAHS